MKVYVSDEELSDEVVTNMFFFTATDLVYFKDIVKNTKSKQAMDVEMEAIERSDTRV